MALSGIINVTDFKSRRVVSDYLILALFDTPYM